MKKILIILLVALALGGGYVAYQYNRYLKRINPVGYTVPPKISPELEQQPPTAKWTQYQNKKYGYTILFPSESILTTHDTNMGAADEQTVTVFPPNADSITIKNGPAFISVCEDCGGGGIGIDSIKLEEQINIGGKIYTASGFISETAEQTRKTLFVQIPPVSIVYGYASNYGETLDQGQRDTAQALVERILSTLSL